MKLATTDPVIRRYIAIRAGWRFRIFAPTFVECERTGRLKQVSVGHVECDVQDRASGRYYATAKGRTERDALEKAIDLAEKAAKPLTIAQEADLAAGRAAFIAPEVLNSTRDQLDAAQRRIAELEATIASTKAGKSR